MRLNIGSGDHYQPGWLNIDVYADFTNPPDLVCDIRNLPFEEGVVGFIYCGHVLEHVPRADLPVALREVRRVLADDGELMIVGPDVNLAAIHEPALVDVIVSGGCRWPGDEHQWVSTGERTLAHMRAAGLHGKLIPVGDVPLRWPVVGRDPWQFAIQACKE